MDFLKVSENSRYFIKGGKPFFWMGDTNWPAVGWYSMEELDTYFKLRSAQGFTIAHIMLAWALADGSEKKRAADLPAEETPLWLNNNPATPNDAYFKKLDKVIALAAKYGIMLAILPNGGSGGTHVERDKIITMENIKAFAKYLGRRYKDEPNIVWVNGFDLPPWEHQELVPEFNTGLLEENGGKQLLFFHPCGGTSSNHFHNENWLAGNFIQTWADMDSIQPMVIADYHRYPIKPVVHVEGAYEAGTEYPSRPITAWHVRKQAYWSYMSGGFHTYGHNDLWRKLPSWPDAMNSKGAWQMKILRDFFTSLEWWKLAPDNKIINRPFASGHAAACSCDGDFAVIYYAYRWTLRVETGKIAGGKPLAGTWLDPENGKILGEDIYTGAACDITSPAQCDDAVLLLKA